MLGNRYSVRYTQKYVEDLYGIIDYLVYELHNPGSATRLVGKIEEAILSRLNCPLAFESFQSTRKRKNLYYRIYVGNFVIYYVVIDSTMEVRRILYKGRNADTIIK